MRLEGKRILLCITGGIAAYKAVVLLRLLQKEGAEVRVAMTPAASQFVAPLTFATLSRYPVLQDIWAQSGGSVDWVAHVQTAHWAQAILVAPCTANTLAKLATGTSDNAVTAAVMSASCPVLVAPAMDREMYTYPAVQRNIQTLKDMGMQVVEAPAGYLASGLEGQGRMPEPEDLLWQLLNTLTPKLLAGKQILITAGPTREAMDPVRFISNGSTGKMGYALAEAAQLLGAQVTLVSGPVDILPPPGVHLVSVLSAANMLAAVQQLAPQMNAFIKCAAVSDYSPAEYSDQKLKKTGKVQTLNLNPTQDILLWLGQHRQPGQLLVGFAMETENLEDNARRKLEAKKADYIVLNSLKGADTGFASDNNTVVLFSSKGERTEFATDSKKMLAYKLLQAFFRY